ncbi:glycosyltransferase family 4 protein [Turicibacter sanguinis]|uniref:glycosyltransferase family 4 protein n=1 Tax=Turicibacter sanguinis TaxID=154288 RepID=UPI0018A9A8F3|nr:glycosyltransferase family 4 protein [Turicibacter sanguinis]MDB8564133.1 glycosyltransferase family 4 protein [Turicibacter sanguinis]
MRNNKNIIILRSTSIVNDSRVLKEVKSLEENDYDVKVLGWDRNKLLNSANAEHIEVNLECFKLKSNYGLGIKGILKLIMFQIWLCFKLYVYRREFDIVHCCDLDTAIPATIISKIYRKKVVYDIFDYYTHAHHIPFKFEKIIENIENMVINNADVTIICSEQRFEQISKANPKECIVIHNTPEIKVSDNYLSCIRSKSNKIKIVYVGILQEFRLLREVLEVISTNQQFELHIGGFGVLEDEIIEYARNHDNIFYYGSMKYEEVLVLESECDILFATYDPKIKNHKYSAPNKLYEAMALSKPIIVCKETGIDKEVSLEKIGMVIEYSKQSFSDMLDYILENKKEVIAMGIRGNKLYNKKYTWKSMSNNLIKCYNDL